MNFAETWVVREKNGVFLAFEKHKIKLNDAMAKVLIEGGYDGKEVVMDIRPEDLQSKEMITEPPVDSILYLFQRLKAILL